jgi:hypothetical protein
MQPAASIRKPVCETKSQEENHPTLNKDNADDRYVKAAYSRIKAAFEKATRP